MLFRLAQRLFRFVPRLFRLVSRLFRLASQLYFKCEILHISISSKRRAAEASLDKVAIGSDPPLENVPHFQYLGSRLQGDGSDEADVGHRLEIAQSAFSTLSHLWADHRLSRTTKLRLYRVCVCSSLTHCCEAWTLNRAVTRTINGFNSRCPDVCMY